MNIRGIILDSDGVLTDGGVYVDTDGSETRRFDIKDGLAIVRLLSTGVLVGVVSASTCSCVRYRADKLGVKDVILGTNDKAATVRDLIQRWGLEKSSVIYVGDDLPDLPVKNEVGVFCCPSDAAMPIQAAADYVSTRPGGMGGVREIIDRYFPINQNKL